MAEIFAKRLKTAMNSNNINLSKLSNISGISKPLISNYLSGNYEAKQVNIYKLSKALNVSPSWLMGYDVPMNLEIEQKEKMFLITFIKLIRAYRITIDDFSSKSKISIETINSWLDGKEIPNDDELLILCNFFDINDSKDWFNGNAYFNVLEKNNKMDDESDNEYDLSIMLEEIIEDISDELNISKEKIKSILLDRKERLNILVSYDDLYNFVLRTVKNKLNID